MVVSREGKEFYDRGGEFYGAAAEMITRAIAADATEAGYFEGRRECYQRLNMLEEALDDSREILRLKGDTDINDHTCRIHLLLHLRELGSAQGALSRARTFFPNWPALNKDLPEQLMAAQVARNLTRAARKAYESREQAPQEMQILTEVKYSI